MIRIKLEEARLYVHLIEEAAPPKRFKYLNDEDLVMNFVHKREQATINQLADYTGISYGSAQQACTRLFKKGQLNREWIEGRLVFFPMTYVPQRKNIFNLKAPKRKAL